MKSLFLLLLFPCVAFADNVVVVDFSAHKLHRFTGCAIVPAVDLVASCSSFTTIPTDDLVPPLPGIWPELGLFLNSGAIFFIDDHCYMTAAFGLPGSGTEYRVECPDAGTQEKR